jgi:hypothetical protein
MTLKSPRSNIMRSKPVEMDRGTDHRGTILFIWLLLALSWLATPRERSTGPDA